MYFRSQKIIKSHPFLLTLSESELSISSPSYQGLVIALGIQTICQIFFKHTHPTDLELEYAIAHIEDEVMPADRLLPVARACLTIRTEKISGISPGQVLTLDAFERVFNSTLKMGNKTEIASLLIIRECLHHLRFSSVTFT